MKQLAWTFYDVSFGYCSLEYTTYTDTSQCISATYELILTKFYGRLQTGPMMINSDSDGVLDRYFLNLDQKFLDKILDDFLDTSMGQSPKNK